MNLTKLLYSLSELIPEKYLAHWNTTLVLAITIIDLIIIFWLM